MLSCCWGFGDGFLRGPFRSGSFKSSHMGSACTVFSDPLVARKGDIEAASPGESSSELQQNLLSSPHRKRENKLGPTFFLLLNKTKVFHRLP